MTSFDEFMKNPYWKSIYDNAPTKNLKMFYKNKYSWLDYINTPNEKIFYAERDKLLENFSNEEINYIIDNTESNQYKAKLKTYLH